MPGMPRPEDITRQAGARPLPEMVRRLQEFGARGGPAPPPAPAFPLDAAGMAAGGVAGAGAARAAGAGPVGSPPPPLSPPLPQSLRPPQLPQIAADPFAGLPNLPPPAEIQQPTPPPAYNADDAAFGLPTGSPPPPPPPRTNHPIHVRRGLPPQPGPNGPSNTPTIQRPPPTLNNLSQQAGPPQ